MIGCDDELIAFRGQNSVTIEMLKRGVPDLMNAKGALRGNSRGLVQGAYPGIWLEKRGRQRQARNHCPKRCRLKSGRQVRTELHIQDSNARTGYLCGMPRSSRRRSFATPSLAG